MKIRRSLTISFEFFPPKTPAGIKQLKDTALDLAEYGPHFFSVTFGAGGTTREGTFETVNMLQNATRLQIAPHLACIGVTRYEMLKLLHQYRQAGIKHIVALRGDLPAACVKQGDLSYASELVKLIREEMHNTFYIDVAAYPEIHPAAQSAFDDILNLKRKYDAGANSAITQYFFNPDAYFYFLDECSRSGVDMPIVPGIMPVTQFSKLASFSDRCGAEIPRWMRKRFESYHDDESIRAFATEIVYQLCQRLISGGAPGLHFYTLNKANATIELLGLLGFKTSETKNISKLASEGGI